MWLPEKGLMVYAYTSPRLKTVVIERVAYARYLSRRLIAKVG